MDKKKRIIISVTIIIALIIFMLIFNKLSWSSVFLMKNSWIKTSVVSLGVISLLFLNRKREEK